MAAAIPHDLTSRHPDPISRCVHLVPPVPLAYAQEASPSGPPARRGGPSVFSCTYHNPTPDRPVCAVTQPSPIPSPPVSASARKASFRSSLARLGSLAIVVFTCSRRRLVLPYAGARPARDGPTLRPSRCSLVNRCGPFSSLGLAAGTVVSLGVRRFQDGLLITAALPVQSSGTRQLANDPAIPRSCSKKGVEATEPTAISPQETGVGGLIGPSDAREPSFVNHSSDIDMNSSSPTISVRACGSIWAVFPGLASLQELTYIGHRLFRRFVASRMNPAARLSFKASVSHRSYPADSIFIDI